MQYIMSQKFDGVRDIDDSKETWRLAVRILDVWTVINNKGIEHLEMVLIDAKVVIKLKLFFLTVLYCFFKIF